MFSDVNGAQHKWCATVSSVVRLRRPSGKKNRSTQIRCKILGNLDLAVNLIKSCFESIKNTFFDILWCRLLCLFQFSGKFNSGFLVVSVPHVRFSGKKIKFLQTSKMISYVCF